jgi:pyridoxine 5-phosphate synthase
MARLSVNLNKVALLRNSRHTGVPDVLRFGRIAHDAGADGLTVHPRPTSGISGAAMYGRWPR